MYQKNDEEGFLKYLDAYQRGDVPQEEGAYHRKILELAADSEHARRVFATRKSVRAGRLEEFVEREVVFD